MTGDNIKKGTIVCPFTFAITGTSQLTGQPVASVQNCLEIKCALYDWIEKKCGILALSNILRRLSMVSDKK